MAYPQETWIMIEMCYRSGKYRGVEELHEKCEKLLSTKIPSIDAIKKRCAAEKWVRGSEFNNIKEKTEELIKDKFAKYGMPEDKVVRNVIDIIKSKSPAIKEKGVKLYMDMTGTRAPAKQDVTSDGEKLSSTLILIPKNKFDPNV